MFGKALLGARVLLVDAEEASRRLFENFLAGEGFDVRGAGTKEGALDLIESGWAEVVLVEKVLPDGSGLDVVVATRRYDDSIPVLLLSSFAGLEGTLDGLRMGAFDFVVKPVLDLGLLAEKLRRALRQRQLESQCHLLARRVDDLARSVRESLDAARQAVENDHKAQALEQLDRALEQLEDATSQETSTPRSGRR